MSGERAAGNPAEAALCAGRWEQACRRFTARLSRRPDGRDFEGLARAAWWLDDGATCLTAEESAYRWYREAGDDLGAGRAASSLSYDAFLFGDGPVVARGWWYRAEDLLAPLPEHAEHGWLAVRRAELALATHAAPGTAAEAAHRARGIGRETDDADLIHAATALEGLARTASGRVTAGIAQLDSAVAAALAGEVCELMWMGKILCWLITACRATQDVARAQEWCLRVEAICAQRNLDPLLSVCRLQHAAILIEHGTWQAAEDDLTTVMAGAVRSRRHTGADAVIQLGELRRRQGRFAEAEKLLEQAEFDPAAIVSKALINLAAGRSGAAWAALDALLAATPRTDRCARARLLLPAVRAAVAAGDLQAADAACSELRATADVLGNGPLRGMAAAATAMLATGPAAREMWQAAVSCFHEAQMPYDEAEARLGLARALAGTDDEAAIRQATTAARSCEHLQAQWLRSQAAQCLSQVRSHGARAGGAELTKRELDVLRLVAQGLTNQQIAQTLVLSPHTVHRHVTNILAKLGQPSRAAAVAAAMAGELL